MAVTCGAKTRDGGTCQKPPCEGRTRCRLHGGAAGSGRPVLHGRDSHLRGTFGEVWQAVRDDPQMVRFEADIALALVRERELIERLDDGDSPTFRVEALKRLGRFQTATAEGDAVKMRATLRDLETWIKDGWDRDGTWEELQKNADRRASLAEKMASAEAKAQNVVTGKQFVVLLGQIFDIIRSELGDDGAYRVGRRFQSDLVGRVEPGGSLPALSGDASRPA